MSCGELPAKANDGQRLITYFFTDRGLLLCGIFGIALRGDARLSYRQLEAAIARLFRLSQRRGKEAAGIAVRTSQSLEIYKSATAATHMIRTKPYRAYLQRALAPAFRDGALAAPTALIGHARLVTNGRFGIGANNQPVRSGGIVAVHNGIVVNDSALWKRYPHLQRNAEVDSEVLPALMEHFLARGMDVASAVREVFAAVEGEANVAMLFRDRAALLLATNSGSLYVAASRQLGAFVFASEGDILKRFIERSGMRERFEAGIEHLSAGKAGLIALDDGSLRPFQLAGGEAIEEFRTALTAVPIVDPAEQVERRRARLRRCTRCILPETFPGITFDGTGICNLCRGYRPFKLKGLDELRRLADRHRRTDGGPDCVIGLSGGRDSSYGLHFIKCELGMNPVAYTYDWALVTDLARRNQSRLCGQLGVEHVLVSANIARKRDYIRRNVGAWLHKPELGMVPLFMAGDKMYFYYYQDVARRYGVELKIVCGNRFEMTDFKSGFAGVATDPGGERYVPYAVSGVKKLRLALFYLRNFLRNPRYFNRSLADTAVGFYSAYVLHHDFLRLYDYIEWDEGLITRTLRELYDWEEATDTDTTWRIGDGTAAFYNHIYYTMAGFSEHDTFRSQQIRAGQISREEGLVLAQRDNQPRFESIREYANVIGIDLDQALTVIDGAEKLY